MIKPHNHLSIECYLLFYKDWSLNSRYGELIRSSHIEILSCVSQQTTVLAASSCSPTLLKMHSGNCLT